MKSIKYLPKVRFNRNTNFCLIHCHVYGQVNLDIRAPQMFGWELKKGSRDWSSCMRAQLQLHNAFSFLARLVQDTCTQHTHGCIPHFPPLHTRRNTKERQCDLFHCSIINGTHGVPWKNLPSIFDVPQYTYLRTNRMRPKESLGELLV